MSMVETALYSPLIPAADPVAARMFLPCRASRTTIIRVRRMLSETEIERYGTPNWENLGSMPLAHGCCRKYSITIPIPILIALAQSIAEGLWGGRMRTKRGKVQEAGKDDRPEVCGVDDVATVDLGAEHTLHIRASGRGIGQRTNQKTIR